MVTLEKLSLAGMRRFGRKTTIEFSPHATILLAPNGTGKTTVFEAIELALTGVISRLSGENQLKAVVGEGAECASVKLTFNGVRAEASVTAQGSLTLGGDVSGLFPNVASEDVPYLLRLTHLLDQRERSWFIQADPKDAGQSLSKLPIGREGAIAGAALVPVRKIVTERIKANIASTAAVIAQQQEWETLVAERDRATSASNTSLKPIEIIYQDLSELALLGGMEETLAPDWRSWGGKVQALSAFHATLSAQVSSRQARLIEKTEQLASFVGAVQSYQSDKQRMQEDMGKMANLRLAIEKLQAEQSTGNAAREAALRDRVNSESGRTTLDAKISAIRNVRRARDVLNTARAKSSSDVWTLQAAELELADIRTEVSKLAGYEEELARSSHQVSSLMSLESSLLRASQAAEEWRAELADATRLEAEAVLERDQITLLGALHTDAVSVHADAVRNQREVSTRYAAAAASVSELRHALSLIVAHLPAGSEDCPACGAHHGAEELERRLQSSLSTDHAAMQFAELELKQANERVDTTQSAVGEQLHTLQSARSRLSGIQDRLSELYRNADAYARAEHLAGWSTPEMAIDAILERLTKVHAEVAAQKDLMDLAARRIDQARALELRSSLAATQSRVEDLRYGAKVSRELVESATINLANAQQEAPDKDIPELEEERAVLDERIKVQASTVEALEKEFAEKARLIHSLNLDLSTLELIAGEAHSRVAVLESRWRNLPLPGTPSREIIDASIESSESDLQFVQRSIEWLGVLSRDLEARLISDQQNSIQELIDQKRGATQEAAFADTLQKQKSRLDVEALELTKLSAALESLSRKLAEEIDNVYDYIAAVVPSWQVLLKRIVREPRFSGTTLGLQNHYRRPVASVSVQMNGEEIAAPLVASEAQMTDLQLTFLLSMALNHKWSSWRALLLDDPTQHHDLVHASSVFDVLRDYIVDHGFQVILATHDAAQARYFKRKLLNDGVDARIWSLVPEDSGVVAKETR